MNAVELPEKTPHDNLRVIGVADATTIAKEEIGIPATNTCMLGVFAKTTGWLSLESIVDALGDYFKDRLLEKNVRIAERGFRETKVRLIE